MSPIPQARTAQHTVGEAVKPPTQPKARLEIESASALSSRPHDASPKAHMSISQKIRDLIRSAWDDGARVGEERSGGRYRQRGAVHDH